MNKIVATDHAPKAIGPYSQAVWAGNLLFCSGQIPLDPKTGNAVTGPIKQEAEQVLENLKAVVEAAGLTLGQVVKTTVYLTDLENFVKVNEVYSRYFKDAPPARACVQVSRLPKGAQVEIEAIAYRS